MQKTTLRIIGVIGTAALIGGLAMLSPPTLALTLGLGAVMLGAAMANGLDPITKILKPVAEWVADKVKKVITFIRDKIVGLFSRKKPATDPVAHEAGEMEQSGPAAEPELLIEAPSTPWRNTQPSGPEL